MPCHDTKDNAGFIPDSRTITIIIVVSFLFYASYFTGITILVMFYPRRHSSKKVKIFKEHKRPTPLLIQRFFKIQNYCFASPTVLHACQSKSNNLF